MIAYLTGAVMGHAYQWYTVALEWCPWGKLPLNTLAVIPARYGSTRFPGKPLALIAGKPMILWVYDRVSRVTGFDNVVVATDHPDIEAVVKAHGGQVVLTRPDHPSGSDRVWEAAQAYPQADFIFNIQGDEPLINPLYLEEAVAALSGHYQEVDIVTLSAPLGDLALMQDPNVVKVVTTPTLQALYFSRAAIPFARDPGQSEAHQALAKRHLGVYGYKRIALQRFVSLPPSPLECLEQLEQLRALEDGMRIMVLPVAEGAPGIDTPEDLKQLEALLASS